ncbi:MAG: hypothetical protein R2809_12765 [Flavobacteriales bacterium]
MKRILIIFALLSFFLSAVPASAQTRKGHMTQKERVQMNKKSQRWAKKRMKAAKGDLTNVKCTTRQSRRYARKAR